MRRLSALFSESLTLNAANKIRRGFQTLSLNVCGMFFLTFGIYCVAASLILHYFNSSFAGNVSVFSGAVMTVSSLPMLFSKDNISNALYSSRIGYALCDSIDVRMVTLRKPEKTGHMNQGFALGVIAGTLSIALTTRAIISALLIVAVCGVTFALPAAGIVFMAVAAPFFSDRVFALICAVTFLSFIIKLMRGKRSMTVHFPDILFFVFVLYIAVRTAFGPAALTASPWKYVMLLLPYFLSSRILKNFNDAVKAPVIISVSCAALAAVYCISYGIDVLTDVLLPHSEINGAYLYDAVKALPLFSSGAAPLMIASAIPVSVGTSLRSDHRLPRAVFWICALSDFIFLMLTNSVSYMCVAALAVTFTVILYGRKWGFAALAAIYVSAASFIFAGGFTGTVSEYFKNTVGGIYQRGSDFIREIVNLPSSALLFGSGDPAADSCKSFYSHLIYSYGVPGLFLLILFVITVIILSISFIASVYGTDKKQDVFDRFGAVRSSSDTRLGVAVPLSGAFSILAGGLFTDIFRGTTVYMLLFMYFGIWFAYRRTAQKEISKALTACSSSSSATAAEISIKV